MQILHKMRFSHICLLCLVVLGQGEEHDHSLEELGLGPASALPHQAAVQDGHAGHDHSEGGHSHGERGEHQGGQEEEGGPGREHIDYDETQGVEDYR